MPIFAAATAMFVSPELATITRILTLTPLPLPLPLPLFRGRSGLVTNGTVQTAFLAAIYLVDIILLCVLQPFSNSVVQWVETVLVRLLGTSTVRQRFEMHSHFPAVTFFCTMRFLVTSAFSFVFSSVFSPRLPFFASLVVLFSNLWMRRMREIAYYCM